MTRTMAYPFMNIQFAEDFGRVKEVLIIEYPARGETKFFIN